MRARSRTRAGWRASQLPCPRRSIAISPSPHTQPPDLRSGGIRPFPSILLPASLSSPASVLASISTTARPFVSATRRSFGPCRLSCCYLLGRKASFLRKSNVPEQRPRATSSLQHSTRRTHARSLAGLSNPQIRSARSARSARLHGSAGVTAETSAVPESLRSIRPPVLLLLCTRPDDHRHSTSVVGP